MIDKIKNTSVTPILKKILIFTVVVFVGMMLMMKDIYNKESVIPKNVTSSLFISSIDLDPLDYALSFYGVNEKLPGGQSNPMVLSFYEEFSGEWVVTNSDVAWCSAFLCSVYASCGYTQPGSLLARSWLKAGEHVDNPRPGDVTVLWRGSKDSWKGHVGTFVNQDDNYVYLLGGNQSNKVKVSAYPKYRVLGHRRMVRSGTDFFSEGKTDTLLLTY